MKITVKTWLLAGFVAGALVARADAHAHAPSIVVELPSALPEAARQRGADICLHDSNDGQAYLYIEAADGKKLSILNVTDPGRIRTVGEIPVRAAAPFDFLQSFDATTVLVRYRDNSGFGTLKFSKYDHPYLDRPPSLVNAGTVENLGGTGVLLVSAGSAAAVAGSKITNYDVVDTSGKGPPRLLATIPGVTRRVSKDDTGTLFFLSDAGLTVVRNLREEEAHATYLWQESGR